MSDTSKESDKGNRDAAQGNGYNKPVQTFGPAGMSSEYLTESEKKRNEAYKKSYEETKKHL